MSSSRQISVDVIPARQMPSDLVKRWIEIVEQSPDFASPFFQPEYVTTVATVRRNVEVGILRQGSDVVGFFPFERQMQSAASPVGGWLSGYQGVIAPPDVRWTVADILGGCHLKAWRFDHQLCSQTQLEDYVTSTEKLWQINVKDYESYIEQRKAAGTSMTRKLAELNKLQRDHEVRFVWHTTSDDILIRLLEWKSDHFFRTSGRAPSAKPLFLKLVRALLRKQSARFGGVLSAMFVDDELVAAQFGLRARSRMQYILPSYGREFSRYSPGICQLLMLVQNANRNSISCIDLGKGDYEYKRIFATDSLMLATGSIEHRTILPQLVSAYKQARHALRISPLGEPALRLMHWAQRPRLFRGRSNKAQ